MRKGVLFFSLCFTILSAAAVFPMTPDEKLSWLRARTGTHQLSAYNPGQCKTCHAGIRYLGGIEEESCYICHGERSKATRKVRGFTVTLPLASDIRKEFEKSYRHPVEKMGLHAVKEKFPVIDPKVSRHAECLDCHEPHKSLPDTPLWGATGVGADGKFKTEALEEYEVCFKCHGADANKPVAHKNKLREFDPANPSFHPVLIEGKNNYLPSLEKGMTYESIITCTSCHGSEQQGGKRLRGVHGSANRYILILPYTRDEESLKPQYDLCYKCHRKESILENQSFRYHREHIEGVKSRGWKGTSCTTCHNSHGAKKYRFLIDFNPDYVVKESKTNKLDFVSEGVFKGTCYLRCHNVEHDPKSYGN